MSLLRWLFGKTTSNWDLVTWLAGSVWTLVGGVVIGWAAWAAGIFSHYAPFSWAAAGLIGTIIAAFVFLANCQGLLLVHPSEMGQNGIQSGRWCESIG